MLASPAWETPCESVTDPQSAHLRHFAEPHHSSCRLVILRKLVLFRPPLKSHQTWAPPRSLNLRTRSSAPPLHFPAHPRSHHSIRRRVHVRHHGGREGDKPDVSSGKSGLTTHSRFEISHSQIAVNDLCSERCWMFSQSRMRRGKSSVHALRHFSRLMQRDFSCH